MPALPPPLDADRWLIQMFQSRSAAGGGIVRRKLADVDRIVGRARFLAELDRRGYRAVTNAGQVVVFCNRERVTPLR